MKTKLIFLFLLFTSVTYATRYHFQPGQKITYDWTVEDIYLSETKVSRGKSSIWTARGVGKYPYQLIFLTEFNDTKTIFYADVNGRGVFADNPALSWGSSPQASASDSRSAAGTRSSIFGTTPRERGRQRARA